MGNTDTLGNIDYTRQSVKTNKTKKHNNKKTKKIEQHRPHKKPRVKPGVILKEDIFVSKLTVIFS